jgi:hypothetical protein
MGLITVYISQADITNLHLLNSGEDHNIRYYFEKRGEYVVQILLNLEEFTILSTNYIGPDNTSYLSRY